MHPKKSRGQRVGSSRPSSASNMEFKKKPRDKWTKKDKTDWGNWMRRMKQRKNK